MRAISIVVAVGASQGAIEIAWADAPPSNVRAEVRGIRSMKGKIGCALYASAKGFPKEPAAAAVVVWMPIRYDSLTCEFPNRPAGSYAIAVFHDENGNGKLDTNFVGAPSEGYGSSNNVAHSFSPPSWEESKFELKIGTTVTAKIDLHY